MGQKVNPISLRLGISTKCSSSWYAEGDNYSHWLHQDISIKRFIKDTLKHASIAGVNIGRLTKQVRVTIHTAKQGILTAKQGDILSKIKAFVTRLTGDEVFVNIVDIRRPEVEAKIVADTVARQLESSNASFKKIMKGAIRNARKMGALGIKVMVSGRLGGAEIARTEWDMEGRVPLHTLRAIINYATATANTTYGVIGVKIWIYKGEMQQ